MSMHLLYCAFLQRKEPDRFSSGLLLKLIQAFSVPPLQPSNPSERSFQDYSRLSMKAHMGIPRARWEAVMERAHIYLADVRQRKHSNLAVRLTTNSLPTGDRRRTTSGLTRTPKAMSVMTTVRRVSWAWGLREARLKDC